MERVIGEVFQYDSVKLRVVKNWKNKCNGCYFENKHICSKYRDLLGYCSSFCRDDNRDVIFREIKIIDIPK